MLPVESVAVTAVRWLVACKSGILNILGAVLGVVVANSGWIMESFCYRERRHWHVQYLARKVGLRDIPSEAWHVPRGCPSEKPAPAAAAAQFSREP